MAYIDSTNQQNAVFQIQQKLKDLDFLENGRIRMAADGYYGNQTKNAVQEFQKKYHLDPTGIVDKTTWDALNTVHQYRCNEASAARAVHIFPKDKEYIIFPGDEDDVLYVIKHMLNIINLTYDDWNALEYNNLYNETVQNAIRAFQRKNLLDDNGVIDSKTFNRLADEYERINSINL